MPAYPDGAIDNFGPESLTFPHRDSAGEEAP